jgi:S-DNA-T family DNA segregation ATPase FtsK/SpoIIIE
MTVPLTVRHVRDALYSHEGGEAEEDTRPSTLLLGQLFHKIVSDLLVAEAELGKDQWKASLIEHTYRRLVGPMLSREQSRLHDVADRVLSFWQAVQEMCGWLAGVLWAARGRNILRGDLTWAGGIGEPFFNSELSLEWEVREGGWTDAVRLTGLADLVLRIPGEGRWCVVELKLGRGSPAADLMQACLYHLMLTAQNRLGTPAMGTLAMVSFRPACNWRASCRRGRL